MDSLKVLYMMIIQGHIFSSLKGVHHNNKSLCYMRKCHFHPWKEPRASGWFTVNGEPIASYDQLIISCFTFEHSCAIYWSTLLPPKTVHYRLRKVRHTDKTAKRVFWKDPFFVTSDKRKYSWQSYILEREENSRNKII